MKRFERSWMYDRFDGNKRLNLGFVNGVKEFIKHAKDLESFKENNEKMRCPCSKCRNTKFQNEYNVKLHLTKNGFCVNYFDWVCHGEDFPVEDNTEEVGNNNPYQEMVNDALLDRIDFIREEALNREVNDETPNPDVLAFFEMLKKAEEPVYEGSNVSVLQAASRLLTLKCEHNLSHRCVDGICSLIGDIIPKNNLLTTNFYEIKKVLRALQLPHEKIDVCRDGCMLFWKDDKHLDNCKKCNLDRYKPKKNARGKRVPYKVMTYFPLAPRLQRLYATKHVAKEMRWHAENPRASGIMAHPSDADSWKHFDALYPDFASEPRNVRLGLCTDGFAPFGQFGKSYSCWPVMVTPYNLPPWLCMKKQFIFISLIVPGPKNPKGKLDVYLQPLIYELKELWEVGVFTYDVFTKQNFQLRASLMWTINDFPAYGMLSGWSTAGENACPYCGDGNKSLWLKHSGKWSWFDCHRQFLKSDHPFRKDRNFLKKKPIETAIPPSRLSGDDVWECVEHLPTIVDATDVELKKLKAKRKGWWKRSIFWELPYWKALLIRHNLDVMHIEKNFFEQLINTVMDEKKKTSYGVKSKLDLHNLCRKRSNSHFVLDKAKRKVLCEWVSKLKFPDGYASDLSRCIDKKDFTIRGLKSHDCHVFMERLLPVALRDLIPRNEWNAITEISQFFRDLCAATIRLVDVNRLEDNIAEILCKLEKFLPPAFFNSMEHLPVHLPYEVKVGGPVQYRWMYPFERFLNHLKHKIRNKAYVEGSICNGYLLEEISNFCSMYYEEHIDTKVKDLDVGNTSHSQDESSFPELFEDHNGRTTGKCKTRFLEEKEYDSAHKYVLSNCEILRPYEVLFENFIRIQHGELSTTEIWSKYDNDFPKWFSQQATLLNDDLIKALAIGPSRRVKTWKRYSINGFNFRIFNGKTDIEKSTINNGVCVSSTEGADYYGTLDEVVQLEYVGSTDVYKTILFKCDWLDNSDRGMNVHKDYKLVDVHRNRKYHTYEPFVLAYQVEQVYYAPYPSLKKDKESWSAVFKIKARSTIDAPLDESIFQEPLITDVPHLSSPAIMSEDVLHSDNDDEDEIGEDEELAEFINQESDNSSKEEVEAEEEELEEDFLDSDSEDTDNDQLFPTDESDDSNDDIDVESD